MRSKSSHEASGGEPGVSPGTLSRLICSHLHIVESVVKPNENGHDILVSGGRRPFLGILGFPFGSRRSWQALKMLEGGFFDVQESSEDVLIAAQETSVVSKGLFRASQRHPWEAQSVETV